MLLRVWEIWVVTRAYGATASLGWQWNRAKTNISVLYSGTYDGMVRYSNLDAYNQSLSISAVRTLTPNGHSA